MDGRRRRLRNGLCGLRRCSFAVAGGSLGSGLSVRGGFAAAVSNARPISQLHGSACHPQVVLLPRRRRRSQHGQGIQAGHQGLQRVADAHQAGLRPHRLRGRSGPVLHRAGVGQPPRHRRPARGGRRQRLRGPVAGPQPIHSERTHRSERVRPGRPQPVQGRRRRTVRHPVRDLPVGALLPARHVR